MKVKSDPRARMQVTAFWDTSGLVPLCCLQLQTALANRTARSYARQVTWWATAIEAVSSINRLYRERALTAAGRQQALTRLTYLRRRWNEIAPSEEVRDGAERLLGVHTLRAGDALQLSAALVWCGQRPQGRPFVGADGALATAAEAEGFRVIRLM
jgi:uncharacterized protein